MVKYVDEDSWRDEQIFSCRKTISLIENHIQSASLGMKDDFDGTKDRFINVLLEAKEKIYLEITELLKASEIDTDFNVYSDTPKGKDPDSFSPTLRKYHYVLWSKYLPNGKYFFLDLDTPRLLHHKFELGEYFLSSDAITHGYSNVKKMARIIEQIRPEEVQEFDRICSTIGGYIIFPAKRIDNKMTINGARGCSHKIQDRFDLTLECIRRFYKNQFSPLTEVLDRYSRFFDFFVDFKGYIEFFLLQDLVTEDCSEVLFWHPFDNFEGTALPQDLEEYLAYKDNVIEFVKSRNQRIRYSQSKQKENSN